MKIYTVTYDRLLKQLITVKVKAEDEDEAIELAKDEDEHISYHAGELEETDKESYDASEESDYEEE